MMINTLSGGRCLTFSIVARDPQGGALGVATATAGPAVGSLVPHVRAGLGAIATQALTNPYLAYDSLRHLGSMPAKAALEQALAEDAGRDRRQIILVDGAGGVAGWTGPACSPYAGHLLGKGFAVAGNILVGPAVLDAMAKAFQKPGILAERLLASLAAGHAAGGDSRGTGSAAVKVHTTEDYPLVDLRIDLTANPVADLQALYRHAQTGGYAAFVDELVRRGV